jgi:hypothetical protein
MKFLLVVLALHIIGELISNKRKDNKQKEDGVIDSNVRQPAEFELR